MQLNLDKDSSRLWRLTRTMNDEDRKSAPITLNQNEELLTGEQAADLLINRNAGTSDIQVPWDRKEDVKKAQQHYIDTSGEPIMNSHFTVAELHTALATLQLKIIQAQTRSQMRCCSTLAS